MAESTRAIDNCNKALAASSVWDEGRDAILAREWLSDVCICLLSDFSVDLMALPPVACVGEDGEGDMMVGNKRDRAMEVGGEQSMSRALRHIVFGARFRLANHFGASTWSPCFVLYSQRVVASYNHSPRASDSEF